MQHTLGRRVVGLTRVLFFMGCLVAWFSKVPDQGAAGLPAEARSASTRRTSFSRLANASRCAQSRTDAVCARADVCVCVCANAG